MSRDPAEPTCATVAVTRPGGPDSLTLVSRPRPKPAADEVLIAVSAAGLNHVDLRQRMGLNPMEPRYGNVPGLEVAGHVVETGADVRRWRKGDAVCALLSGGGYATYACASEDFCLPIPERLDVISAAAFPEALFTAWSALVDMGRINAGENVLVHGGSSGVGTAAIQLARLLGANVLATAGSAEKCRASVALGAVQAIDYRNEELAAAVKEATSGKGVDVIVDILGGSYLQRHVDALAPRGRVVTLAFLAGARGDIDLQVLAGKHATITGGFLRDLSVAEKTQLARTIEARVWPWIEKGLYRPVIDGTFDLADAAAAHRTMESRRHVGKILLLTGTQGA